MLVTDAAEAMDLVGQLGRDAAPRQSAPVRIEDDLDPLDRAVLAVVPFRAAGTADQVCRSAAVPPAQARAALARLELLELVTRRGDRWRKVGAGATS